MGAKHWVLIALLAVIAYRWYPTTEHNILVLVNSKTFDVSEIAQVKNLKAAFRIDKNIDEHMKRGNKEELERKVTMT